MTVYLDNAASSCPKPASVVEAVDGCLRGFCANPGRGAHRKAVGAARIIYRTREAAARLIGAVSSRDIIFTQNATDSLNLALHGLLEAGDHVVSSTVEHNAVLRPLLVLARRGVEVSLAPSGSTGLVDPEAVLEAIRPNTRLAVLNHASNVTGAVQPVEELVAALNDMGVPLLVDAAQSAGTLPLNVGESGIAMVALTGHKSLMGPQGVGMLYIDPQLKLMSVRQGGTGSRSEEPQDQLARPDRYESGTLNTPGIAGLGAGIAFIEEQGLERLAAHKRELTVMLMAGLAEIPSVQVYGPSAGKPRAPLISFNVGSLPSTQVAALLDRDYDIASRAGLHCAPGAHEAIGTRERGAVRLSVGPFNTREEINQAVEAVAKIAAEQS